MIMKEQTVVQPELPPYFLPRPPMDLDADLIAAFDRLLADATQRGPEEAIDYTLDAPKWQFLCYLCEAHDVIMHGSGSADITEFEARQSNDTEEFGNRRAVYAASDGIWPMYFAIANRDGPVGSLINACFRVVDGEGNRSRPYYFFSINEDAFEGNTWRNGMVYVLPRATFEQQPLDDSRGMKVEIEQWASPVNVKPLAKLDITPDDFPFLAQVRGHNNAIIGERVKLNPGGFPWLAES